MGAYWLIILMNSDVVREIRFNSLHYCESAANAIKKEHRVHNTQLTVICAPIG